MTTPTLSDDAMLMRAICARPDDDAPRLVFADWLDEHGRYERAEFVRVQIELAKWKDEQHCPTCGLHWQFRVGLEGQSWCNDDHAWEAQVYRNLRQQERALFSQIAGQFDLPHVGTRQIRLDSQRSGGHDFEYIVRRGFVDEVRLPVAALCGGPCVTCQEPFYYPAGCHACHGTGRTPGIAAQLARLPLTRVRVVGREPDNNWWWWRDTDAGTYKENPAYLPPELFGYLDHPRAKTHNGIHYPTRQAAIDALDAAALLYIRTS